MTWFQRHRATLMAVVIALVFGTGPAVGDVGGCGETANDLPEGAFLRARKSIDCNRCAECAIATNRCADACSNSSIRTSWPSTCRPLWHDGEVCLNALEAASCSAYAAYMSDENPSVPSECDFCRQESAGDASAGTDAGTDSAQ